MKVISALVMCLLVSAVSLAQAEDKTYGDIKDVRYVRNYDADTITFNILGIPTLLGEEIPVRIAHIDTPELKGKCEWERTIAREAQKFVRFTIRNNTKHITLKNTRRDKYFRILADVYLDDMNLAETLIQVGYAVPYEGETKHNWCKEEKK